MIINDDVIPALQTAILPNSIDVIFTSPSPVFYHYLHNNIQPEQVTQEVRDTIIGAETDNYGYANHIIHMLDECQKVLKPRGSLFLQLADYHDNLGPKATYSYRLVPELIMLTIQRTGWYLQGKIIWHKPVDFKLAKQQSKGFVNDWEYIYHLTKQPFPEYEFNKSATRFWSKSVWEFPDTTDTSSNEFRTGFPEKIIEGCIKSTIPNNKDSIVLDPLAGSGTTGLVAKRLGYRYIMIDINKDFCQGMQARLNDYGDMVPMKSEHKYIAFNPQDTDERTNVTKGKLSIN